MDTDKGIKRAVEAEIDWDPSIAAQRLTVSVRKGVVRVVGRAASLAEREAIENAAHRVMGVKGVRVDVSVVLSPQDCHSDAALNEAVMTRLTWSSGLAPGTVLARVLYGWADLSGEVDHAYQRELAEHVVRSMRGICGVRNHMTVRASLGALDITTQIWHAMQRYARREVAHIQVEIEADTVRLSGRVCSHAERVVARRAALAAPGVKNVVDLLTVE